MKLHIFKKTFAEGIMSPINLRTCAVIMLLFLYKNGYLYAEFLEIHRNASIVTDMFSNILPGAKHPIGKRVAMSSFYIK